MEAIERIHGKNANLYTEVLRIQEDATPAQIREAFFCLRYDVYQKLNAPNAHKDQKRPPLTQLERRKMEEQMDAITSAFRVLSDPNRRLHYDATLRATRQAAPTNESDNKGTPVASSSSEETPSAPSPNRDKKKNTQTRTVFRKREAANVTAKVRSNALLPPPPSPPNGSSRRGSKGTLRGPPTAVPGGINNASPRAVARPVTGGMNHVDRLNASSSPVVAPAPSVSAETPSPDASVANPTEAEGNWANFGPPPITAAFSEEMKFDTDTDTKGSSSMFSSAVSNNFFDEQLQTPSSFDPFNDGTVPEGVDNLNLREQVLFKNQLFIQSQQKLQQNQNDVPQYPSRLKSRYDSDDRVDWLICGDSLSTSANGSGSTPIKPNNKSGESSPRGVDEFGSTDLFENMKQNNSKEMPLGRNAQREQKSSRLRKNSDLENDEEETVASEQDDDTRTYETGSAYDDDCTGASTYDDTTVGETTLGDNTLEETTIGESTIEDTTIGESTFTSREDGASIGLEQFGKPSRFDAVDGSNRKYQPSHKSGNVPDSILKSSSNGSKRRASLRSSASTDGVRRVTIHAHRGRGERFDDEDDFVDAACPFPSFAELREEVSGTYKDASSAFHQVLHAFVISPDDIDRMADKIRDAKVEFTENYNKHTKELRRVVPIEKALSV